MLPGLPPWCPRICAFTGMANTDNAATTTIIVKIRVSFMVLPLSPVCLDDKKIA
jgi:hypothetical protein